MENIDAAKINNHANGKQLIDYLETSISNEIFWSSFIKDLVILEDNSRFVTIGISSEEGKDLLVESHQNDFNRAVQEIWNNTALVANIVFKDNYLILNRFVKKTNKKSYINSKYTFDNYVVSNFNEKARDAARAIIKQPGIFSPLFIYSPSGLGKTHLLHALGNEILKKGQTILYVNPDKFTTKVTNAIRENNNGVERLIQHYSSFDFLLFDDIQNLGNRISTLKVLFNIINESLEEDKQIIFAADKNPNELGGFEERFITRFNKGLTLEIEKPELNDLLSVLKWKLENEKLSPAKWEEEALKFVARNYSTSIRSIEGAVTRIKFFTLDRKEIKYTYSTISNIFKNLAVDKEEMTPKRIISVVANYYKINKSDIYSKTRKKDIVIARHMAMWLVRNILNYPFQKIGEIFGNRDHSTVISGISKIDTAMQINSVIKTAINTIKVKINKVS